MWFGQPLRLGIIGTVFGAALIAGDAQAAPGDHIRAGEAVITPKLSLGFGYRSNAFRSETGAQGAGSLRIAPALSITADTPQVTFALDGEYVIRKFLFLANPDGIGDAQIQDQVNSLDRFNEFNVSAKIQALKDQRVSVHMGDTILLQNNPNDSVPETDDPYATQFRNSLGAGLDARPGPALTIGLDGGWKYATFFVPGSDSPRDAFNTRNSYGPRLDLKYEFLPRTAYVFEAGFTWNSWVDNNPAVGNLAFPTPNSQFLKLRTGVQGRITERLRVVVKAGWGTGWYADSTRVGAGKGILVALQADYDATEQHTITAGYRKNFIDSFFTNSGGHNSFYARWKGQYGDRVTSKLEYSLRLEDYDGFIERNDVVNQLKAGVGVDVREWVNVNASAGWLGRSSTDAIIEYNDVRAGLGATFVY